MRRLLAFLFFSLNTPSYSEELSFESDNFKEGVLSKKSESESGFKKPVNHHSDTLPSEFRQIGLCQSWLTKLISFTYSSLISTPKPGLVGIETYPF